jgi:hypothetical protein
MNHGSSNAKSKTNKLLRILMELSFSYLMEVGTVLVVANELKEVPQTERKGDGRAEEEKKDSR